MKQMVGIYSRFEIHGDNSNGMVNMAKNQAYGVLSWKNWLDLSRKMTESSTYPKTN